LLIKHNGLFYSLLNFLHKTGFISTRLYEFIANQTGSREDQERVYKVWTFLRKIEPKIKVLGGHLTSNNITCQVFIGTFDRIIPLKNTRRLKRSSRMVDVELIRSGHQLLKPSIARELIKEGRWKLD
jgi:hypothetical protein